MRARRTHSAASGSGSLIATASLVVASMAAMAAVNLHLAKKAEAANPPKGRFVEVNGVRLHYVDRGDGDPIVLLHGNGSMVEISSAAGSSTSRPSNTASLRSTAQGSDTASAPPLRWPTDIPPSSADWVSRPDTITLPSDPTRSRLFRPRCPWSATFSALPFRLWSGGSLGR